MLDAHRFKTLYSCFRHNLAQPLQRFAVPTALHRVLFVRQDLSAAIMSDPAAVENDVLCRVLAVTFQSSNAKPNAAPHVVFLGSLAQVCMQPFLGKLASFPPYFGIVLTCANELQFGDALVSVHVVYCYVQGSASAECCCVCTGTAYGDLLRTSPWRFLFAEFLEFNVAYWQRAAAEVSAAAPG